MKNVFETQTRLDQTLHLKRFISTKKHVNANSGDEVMKKLEKREVAENFKGFLKMRDSSLMRAYRGTSIKMRTCPAKCRTVCKYVFVLLQQGKNQQQPQSTATSAATLMNSRNLCHLFS